MIDSGFPPELRGSFFFYKRWFLIFGFSLSAEWQQGQRNPFVITKTEQHLHHLCPFEYLRPFATDSDTYKPHLPLQNGAITLPH